MKSSKSIDYRQIGVHIRTTRKSAGRTQENLAEALLVSVGYISQLERGVTKISLDTLSNIAAFLDCDLTSLLTGVSPQRGDYLYAEFSAAYNAMDDEKRRLLLAIAQCILTQ